MKTTKLLLAVIVIFSSFVSCKKDKTEPDIFPPLTYKNYSCLKVGNYWIYERYDVSGDGSTANATGIIDSCYIEKDTIINSKTYFKMHRPNLSGYWQSDYYLRDSLHYLVDNYGNKWFSSQDFTQILKESYSLIQPGDTICRIERKMVNTNGMITITSGSFSTLNAKETYYMYPNFVNAGNPRIRNNHFAENVGIISETLTFFASNPNYIERRLIRYHLN